MGRLGFAFCIPLLLTSVATAQDGAAPPSPAETTTEEAKAPKRIRVFVAKLSPGSGASAGETSLINDAILVTLRKFDDKFEIRTSQDVEGVMALEAAQTLAGCDVISCAAEVGDALGADQLVTGQLGHVGETWLLSLTRTDRDTLKAITRTQVRATGPAADVLLPLLDQQVAETFGEKPLPKVAEPEGGNGLSTSLLFGGGAGVAIGAVGLVLSLSLYLLSHNQAAAAQRADTQKEFDESKAAGELYYWSSAGLLIAGVVVGLAGAGVLGASFVVGDSE